MQPKLRSRKATYCEQAVLFVCYLYFLRKAVVYFMFSVKPMFYVFMASIIFTLKLQSGNEAIYIHCDFNTNKIYLTMAFLNASILKDK